MSLTTAYFTPASFAALLRSESRRCIRTGTERGWLPAVPEAVLYFFPTGDRCYDLGQDESEVTVQPDSLFSEAKLLPHLFREEDGWFRREIVLSPFALSDGATVIEVALLDPAWTNQVVTGKLAFPHEPFQLRGPRLPPDWREGQPMPMAALPKLREEKTA